MAKASGKNEISDWQVMVDAAKQGLEEQGYPLTRIPSTQAFKRLDGGAQRAVPAQRLSGQQETAGSLSSLSTAARRWKTLVYVDLLWSHLVSPDSQSDVEVYVFPAAEVRKRFGCPRVGRRGNMPGKPFATVLACGSASTRTTPALLLASAPALSRQPDLSPGSQ